ncbi:MAG: linear amide C-N hydrolase, partial [Theionarchaea archaeon]|nr:linear amide C-N hydrolase [Theionarchaea archaeon]
PLHLERARGVALALGVDSEDYTFDTTDISYNQDMPIIPGCSVVYYPPHTTNIESGLLSRNYDFPTKSLPEIMGNPLPEDVLRTFRPLMADPYIMELYPDEGYASLCLTSFELLSGVLDGINSEGLIVAVNGDETAVMDSESMPTNQQRVGLHELQGMRMLLDTCATVEEAKEALLMNKHFHAFMPCHYTIADSEGNSFVFEYSQGHNDEHIIDGTDEPLIVTNHPLHTYPSTDTFPEDAGILETGTSSFERYKILAEILESHNAPYTTDFLKNANESVSVSQVVSWVPDEYREQFASSPGLSRTLWHEIYNSRNKSLTIKFYCKDEPLGKGNFRECYADYVQIPLEC